jgi:putative acetyltransferase
VVAVIIRDERTGDGPGVRRVVEQAFGRVDEADLVDRLRLECAAGLSLVAEREGAIAGHIFFSPVTLEKAPTLAVMGLAPLAVAPAFQRQGVGALLVRRGLEACRRAGGLGVIVLGHPDYYPRFGFVRASHFGLRYEAEVRDEAFMALELTPGAMAGAGGLVRFQDAFRGL